MTDYFTEQETEDLLKCQTVGDMVTFLLNNFNLDLVPSLAEKKLLLYGFDSAMKQLNPDRKRVQRKRILKQR